MAEALVLVRSEKKLEKRKRQESHFFFEKTEILVVSPNSGKIAHREVLGIINDIILGSTSCLSLQRPVYIV